MKKLFFPLIALICLCGLFLLYQSQDGTVDPRLAIDSGIKQYKKENNLTSEEEQKVRVQLALADYLAQNLKPPKNLGDLIPRYFDTLPLDPSTGKPYKYTTDGKKYTLGEQIAKADSQTKEAKVEPKDDFINPNKLPVDDFVYDPNGKRDPFKPFTNKQEVEIDEKTPPLLRYDISQFRVSAVLTDSKGGRFAMVEDTTGVGYPVHLGDAIGINQGKVVSVDPDKVQVLETVTDAAGQSKQELRVIKVTTSGANAKDLKNRPKIKLTR